jgi:hypothetical protein
MGNQEDSIVSISYWQEVNLIVLDTVSGTVNGFRFAHPLGRSTGSYPNYPASFYEIMVFFFFLFSFGLSGSPIPFII